MKDSKDSRDDKDSKDSQGGRDGRDRRDDRYSRDSRDSRDVRDDLFGGMLKETWMRRRFWNRHVAATLVLWTVCAAASAQPADGWVTAAAYSEMHIVVPEDASAIVRQAGELFQRYWQACTSRELTISSVNEGRINVWIGPDLITDDLLDASALEGLGAEGCLVQTFSPSRRYARLGAAKQLIIAGETDRGTLNGVFEFFKRFAGVQWLCEGATAPERLRFTFPEIDFRHAPHFQYREVGRYGPHVVLDSEYRRAHHLSDRYAPGPFGAETLHDLLPPEIYFTEHPEYYALIGGKRVAKDPDGRPAQLCLSNPDVAEAALAEITKMIRLDIAGADPDLTTRRDRVARDPHRKTWSIAPMAGAACECAACRAMEEAGESPAGTLITLVNRVAEGLDTAFPGAGYRAHTLVRGAWRRPPVSIRPRDGVIVQISTADCDFRRRLSDRDSAVNASFVEDLKGWAAIARTLYVWDYGANCSDPLEPHPNLHTIQENIRLFDQYLVKGVYVQLADEPGAEWAELNALRSYLYASMLWDPDLFLDELTERFLDAYYGRASDHVRAYIALCAEKAVAAERLDPLAPAMWFDAEAAAQADTLFEEALALPLSDDQRRRVIVARLPALWVLAGRPETEVATKAMPERPDRSAADILLNIAPADALTRYAAALAIYHRDNTWRDP